jgi:GDP-L-fucose synthase
MKEEYLLTGPLEPTNRPYALAKIAGIEMCWSYNRQFGTQFLAVMPTNLYGQGDNYDLNTSHVIPALIRKFHEAKVNNQSTVTVWGSGTPKREFLYSEDMADACIFLMNLTDGMFSNLLGNLESTNTDKFNPPLVNIGVGDDLSIKQLSEVIKGVVGYKGEIIYDTTKPDGTMRKLLDVTRLEQLGWKARTSICNGITYTYAGYIQ